MPGPLTPATITTAVEVSANSTTKRVWLSGCSGVAHRRTATISGWSPATSSLIARSSNSRTRMGAFSHRGPTSPHRLAGRDTVSERPSVGGVGHHRRVTGEGPILHADLDAFYASVEQRDD